MRKKEVYVMVVGETSRANNWGIYGYNRDTNPKLSKVFGLTAFNHVLTESNTTHKSVPMLLSAVSACTFDSIYHQKSIITAFKEAGFQTAFYLISVIIILLSIFLVKRLILMTLLKKIFLIPATIHPMMNC